MFESVQNAQLSMLTLLIPNVATIGLHIDRMPPKIPYVAWRELYGIFDDDESYNCKLSPDSKFIRFSEQKLTQ